MVRFSSLIVLLCLTAGSSRAEDEGLVDISTVIEAFKQQILEVQAQPNRGCVLRIKQVDFRFEAGTHLTEDVRGGGTFEAFGVKLGGGVSSSAASAGTSVIKITLLPDRLREPSDFDVGPGTVDFANLIINTKQQIEIASATPPHFTVGEVVLELAFSLERRSAGEVSVAIVKAEQREMGSEGHRVVLTLTPPEESGCAG